MKKALKKGLRHQIPREFANKRCKRSLKRTLAPEKCRDVLTSPEKVCNVLFMENKINISDIKIGDRVLVEGWNLDDRDDTAWGTVLSNSRGGEGIRVAMDDPTFSGGHRYDYRGKRNACYYAYYSEVLDHKPKLYAVPDLPAKPAQGALADIPNTLDYLKKVTGVEHKAVTQEIELGAPNGNGSAGYILIKFVREEF